VRGRRRAAAFYAVRDLQKESIQICTPAVAAAMAKFPPRPLPAPRAPGAVPLLRLSGLESFSHDPSLTRFVNVGERCNIAGSIQFKKLILAGNYMEAMAVARKQIEDGARVVDVNGEQWVRNTPQSITPVRNTAKEEAAKQKEIRELNTLLRGLEQGITPGMQRSFADLNPNEQMRYQYAMNRLAELGALGQVDVAAPGTAAPAQGAKPAAGVKPAAKPTDKWKVNK
jgi:hypothetical protein